MSRAIRIAAASAALLALLALAWWGYSAYKKREFQGAVVELVSDSTARLKESLSLPAPDAAMLAAHFKALESNSAALGGLNGSRDRPLHRAAEEYVSEAQATLRRQVAVNANRDTVAAALRALSEHIAAARGRSEEWIREALARKKKLETAYFDYRLAVGGLEKSLDALRELRRRQTPIAIGGLLVDDDLLVEARARLLESSERLGAEVEAARKLSLPR